MKNRSGLSLLELSATLTACTVIIATTTTVIERVMRVHTRSQGYVGVERDAIRLSNQFRADVHAARTATEVPADQNKGVFVRLEFPNGRLAEYARDGELVRRTETGGDKPAWREEYRCPANNELKLQREGDPSRLILLITRPASALEDIQAQAAIANSLPPMYIRAEAIVSRDLRFATPAGQGAAQ